ncbi:thioredoxin 1 [Parabacteroides sp. PF5-5]|uniref:thioredoxin n=1 Tax=unclassified Parabacteroides TaxID=2649774 RepID=UPI0024744058|nr:MULTISPECIES: thioredoxin [unclassified Parabacteroides]MDH6305876.1 thioredoxin 1 [Parabacteroides sp. PH5-39]MDH6317310.1 thioredoxin 1 [Parabacteroides sp. PF5-13]MDH6336318.1 thioredoxin 1 [Parabacteroides sp. PF5-5]MDH6378012.1 thioredoxin 1 [Parabacteroides sp. PH5-33]MDH6394717.1 thioredoxin 1 [Parabacteroides sp. PFB2-22]
MNKLSTFFAFSVILSLFSCSMSAKTESNGKEKVSKGEIIVLDKADFLSKVFNYEENSTQWIYEGDKPCIVDFYADWCGPCKKVSPILKDLAIAYKDDIIIYKVNIDKEKELASAFGIQSIPTLLFIPTDGIPQIAQGALPREEFVKQIDSYLLGKIPQERH